MKQMLESYKLDAQILLSHILLSFRGFQPKLWFGLFRFTLTNIATGKKKSRTNHIPASNQWKYQMLKDDTDPETNGNDTQSAALLWQNALGEDWNYLF